MIRKKTMIKRNPCRIKKVEYREDGCYTVERRGYAQERKTLDGVESIFVMEGGDTQIGYWYPIDEGALHFRITQIRQAQENNNID